jgi:hypothetical protein
LPVDPGAVLFHIVLVKNQEAVEIITGLTWGKHLMIMLKGTPPPQFAFANEFLRIMNKV